MAENPIEGIVTDSGTLSAGLAHAAAPRGPAAITVIRPSRGWVPLRLSELWEYREVLYFLIWRDIKVRYRQTAIGAAWALIQPLMTMLVFTVFFGRAAKMPSDGVPYSLFALAGLVPWTFFANALTYSANSLVHSGDLISKVYFPRLLVPTGRVLSVLPDLVLSFCLLLGMAAWYGALRAGASLLWLPALSLLALVTALGVGFWLSALNVRNRDVQHALPFMVQLCLFATPIAYPSSLLPEPWRTLYGLNPMVGVVEGFRWTLLGAGSVSGGILGVSAVAALAILVSGAFFFRRVERRFADVI